MVELDKSKSVKKDVAAKTVDGTSIDKSRYFNLEVLLEFFAGMAWID